MCMLISNARGEFSPPPPTSSKCCINTMLLTVVLNWSVFRVWEGLLMWMLKWSLSLWKGPQHTVAVTSSNYREACPTPLTINANTSSLGAACSTWCKDPQWHTERKFSDAIFIIALLFLPSIGAKIVYEALRTAFKTYIGSYKKGPESLMNKDEQCFYSLNLVHQLQWLCLYCLINTMISGMMVWTYFWNEWAWQNKKCILKSIVKTHIQIHSTGGYNWLLDHWLTFCTA